MQNPLCNHQNDESLKYPLGHFQPRIGFLWRFDFSCPFFLDGFLCTYVPKKNFTYPKKGFLCTKSKFSFSLIIFCWRGYSNFVKLLYKTPFLGKPRCQSSSLKHNSLILFKDTAFGGVLLVGFVYLILNSCWFYAKILVWPPERWIYGVPTWPIVTKNWISLKVSLRSSAFQFDSLGCSCCVKKYGLCPWQVLWPIPKIFRWG